MCLPYRTIEDITDELTKDEIKIILYEINGLIEKFEAYKQSGTDFSFNIDEWLSYRKNIVKKLEKMIGE